MVILFGLVGVGILWLVGFLLKISMKVLWRLLINGILGVFLLILANVLLVVFQMPAVEIEPLTAVLAGVFGLPYIVLRVLLLLK